MKAALFSDSIIFVYLTTIVKATQQMSKQPGFTSTPQVHKSLLSATKSTNKHKKTSYVPSVVGFGKVVTVVCIDFKKKKKILTAFFQFRTTTYFYYVGISFRGQGSLHSLIEGSPFLKIKRRMYFIRHLKQQTSPA